jgi:hypothetical protein
MHEAGPVVTLSICMSDYSMAVIAKAMHVPGTKLAPQPRCISIATRLPLTVSNLTTYIGYKLAGRERTVSEDLSSSKTP